MIAWHMLTRDEPYRYAIPRSTEDKLRRLRVKVPFVPGTLSAFHTKNPFESHHVEARNNEGIGAVHGSGF